MLRRPGGLRARRPRHPRDRVVLRGLWIVSFRADASPRPTGEDQRQRAAGVDGRPDAAGVPERPRLSASRPPTARASVPVSAFAVALQRALSGAGAETRAALESGRGGHARRGRLPPSARHDTAALRPVDRDDSSQSARALGRIRLLPRALAPLLGLQTRAAL